ncbi:pilus assembly FimT family protein [Synechococcus sp. BA-132 BA5]|uniref:pilus assembly FimT family protein n=1 Tax=Synechococcus sp. BA-132 BA5 TaxID=3110252 RepID=UPI002B1E988B|nr:prepilin-type N-terminal cleavage/methylation domain-containing protein [Synechococcus sp. BA-132 BA5]MEA5415419.1 prepilin-type N-terminal cleavage/methylation domain-containing protein [Synechococcus sp. BA-132 BA5]
MVSNALKIMQPLALLNPRRRADQGFTLIELMVTVAVISILSAVGFRSFSGFLEQQKLRQAALELAGMLRNSRALAMKNGAACQIIQTTTATFGADSSLTGNTCTSTNVPALNLRASSGSSVLMATNATFTFTPNGFASGTSATTLLSSSLATSQWCVSLISPSALIRVGWTTRSNVNACNYVSG